MLRDDGNGHGNCSESGGVPRRETEAALSQQTRRYRSGVSNDLFGNEFAGTAQHAGERTSMVAAVVPQDGCDNDSDENDDASGPSSGDGVGQAERVCRLSSDEFVRESAVEPDSGRPVPVKCGEHSAESSPEPKTSTYRFGIHANPRW